MKVFTVLNSLIYGGAETQVISLSDGIIRAGGEVTVYTLDTNNPRLPEAIAKGITVIQDRKRAKLDFALLRRLRGEILRSRPDIVHGYLFDGNLYACLAAAGTGVPVICSERADNYSLNRNQWLGSRLFRHLSKGLIANSYSGAEFARKNYGYNKNDVSVVWNAIDLARIDAIGARSRPEEIRHTIFGTTRVKIACLVGNLRKVKDYDLAIKVAKYLTDSHTDWRVILIGGKTRDEKAYGDEIERMFKDHFESGKARLLGLRTDVIDLLFSADVLYSTSVNEGFPNAVLEAMAVGLPVVSTMYSDIDLILPRPMQVNKSRCAGDIAQAILDAYELRAEISIEQRRWVESNCTTGSATKKLLNTYEHFLSQT